MARSPSWPLGVGRVEHRELGPALHAVIAHHRRDLVDRGRAGRERKAARLGMDRRRKAVVHRSVLHQRGNGQAHADQARAHDHRGMRRDDGGRVLHRHLRAGLVVVECKSQVPPLHAAGAVDMGGQRLEGVLLALADEGGATGQRQDHLDGVGIGGARRRRRQRSEAQQRQSAEPMHCSCGNQFHDKVLPGPVSSPERTRHTRRPRRVHCQDRLDRSTRSGTVRRAGNGSRLVTEHLSQAFGQGTPAHARPVPDRMADREIFLGDRGRGQNVA